MGKVRTEYIKRIARDLIKLFPDRFTTDFEKNKKLVNVLTNISSTKLRNRVAGYTTRLMAATLGAEAPEERRTE